MTIHKPCKVCKYTIRTLLHSRATPEAIIQAGRFDVNHRRGAVARASDW